MDGAAIQRPSRLRRLGPPARLASDEVLTRRAAAGDRAAFSEIVSRHQQSLYRYCRSLLRSDEDARDALQNTLTSALRGLEGETRVIAVRPWLFRIAHNESMTLARGRGGHLPLEETHLPLGSSAEDDLIATERHRQLITDLGELPERQRSALVMRELSGLSHEDIAEALTISTPAAKQAIYEARTMLHELAEGRAMPCAEIQKVISDGDGRVLRRRDVRSHLRGCAGCAEYRAAIGRRQGDLRAIAPPLAPALAAGVLHAVLGSTGGGASGGGGAALAAAGGSKAAAVGGLSLGMKATAAVLVTASVGAGGYVAQEKISAPHRSAPVHGVPAAVPVAPQAAEQAREATAKHAADALERARARKHSSRSETPGGAATGRPATPGAASDGRAQGADRSANARDRHSQRAVKPARGRKPASRPTPAKRTPTHPSRAADPRPGTTPTVPESSQKPDPTEIPAATPARPSAERPGSAGRATGSH